MKPTAISILKTKDLVVIAKTKKFLNSLSRPKSLLIYHQDQKSSYLLFFDFKKVLIFPMINFVQNKFNTDGTTSDGITLLVIPIYHSYSTAAAHKNFEAFLTAYTYSPGGVVVLPLTSHAEDWVFKSSLRQAVQATKL